MIIHRKNLTRAIYFNSQKTSSRSLHHACTLLTIESHLCYCIRGREVEKVIELFANNDRSLFA